MPTTYTQNLQLQMPGTADRNWDAALNANSTLVDTLSALGGLAVAMNEVPSASLNVRVASGQYVNGEGVVASYAGQAPFALAPSSTTCLWLTDTGTLTTGAAFPATSHVRLASVVTGATTISQVTDQRVQCRSAGTGLGFVLKSGDTMNGTLSIANSSTAAVAFQFNPNTPAISFFGATATGQAAKVTLTDSTTGTAGSVLSDVGTSFNQTVLDANFATIASKINALIGVLQAYGLMSN